MSVLATTTEPLILAAMVSPALFYAGAAAASVPILIHLLSKRRFRRVRWAAMDFLIKADRRNRRRVRLEELILLALRCLAMLLAGLMLARVFVRPEALMAVLGSAARTERIIVLDDSFSMGLRDRGAGPADRRPDGRQAESDKRIGGDLRRLNATVFDRAKSAANRLVHWLGDESPGDGLTLLLTSRPDRALRAETSVGRMDASALSEELETLTPSNRVGNMAAALASVRHLLDARESSVSATVYVVSDFQRADWIPAAGGDQEAGGPSKGETGAEGGFAFAGERPGPAATLAGWAGADRTLRVVLVDVGIGANNNVCIAALEPEQAQAVAGVSTRFIARVRNHGRVATEPSSLQVYVGDAARPPVPLPVIEPGQTMEVPIEVTFPHEGSETLTVERPADALGIDDARACAVPVQRALRVLVVNGEPSADLYQDEVFLLTVALRPAGPQFSGNEITVVDENEFGEMELFNFHAVVLANVFRVTEDTAARLEGYVREGGGLLLFLGDQVDADLYNRILYRSGKGLLPARLGELSARPADQPGVPVGELDLAHPVMKGFRDKAVNHFDGVVARQYLACEPDTVARIATAPAGPATEPAGSPGARMNSRDPEGETANERGPGRVLLHLGDADKNPLIVERSFGEGRVVMVTTSVDKEWNNLADRPVFVVLAMELVQYVARQLGGTGEQLVGEPIRLPLDPARYQPAAALKSPAYPHEPATRVHARPDPETGVPTIHWPHTDRPGIYQFELSEMSGGQALEQVAVNVDPLESDLRRADRTSLVSSMAGLPIEYVSGDSLSGGGEVQARQELWPVLIIALLVVLMSEQALAWWFGSDRRMFAKVHRCPAGRE